MSFLKRFCSVAVVATALFAFGQQAAATPAPQVVVTPSTGLTDGASVSVSITGFPSGESVYVAQCGSVDGQIVICDLDDAGEVVTGSDGEASTATIVHRVFEGYDLDGNLVEVDCDTAPGGCGGRGDRFHGGSDGGDLVRVTR
ncbi:enediyne antibiotic chromoprotein [Actinokineospora pegani]|uniref:enediyne antibiotic chromoprotein n=1 Tax=Actinokineospora pegani TaxID=2654637 RepID=UPI0018D27601|nr:enediyne antibiotic chromoprotein [Actinokineospora pegani]